MYTKRSIVFFFFVLFLTFANANAQGGTPHPPNHISPGNGSTIVTSNNVQLCAAPSDDITSEIHFEIFDAPIDNFNTPWQSGNPVCTVVTVPNGPYTWHARGKNAAGEGGNSPDWTFTVQVGNAPPPTRVPGPENPNPGPSQPNCSNVLPAHLSPGDIAYETLSAENIQAGPGYNEKVEGAIGHGTKVVVIGGPTCADGYWWIHIQTPSNGTWWAIEGDGNSYWLDKTSGGSGNNNSNPAPANDLNPPVNAQGIPLIKNSDGVYTYLTAYGSGNPPSGSYIHVPTSSDGLFLRTSSDTSSKKNVIGRVHPGDYYSVIQTSGDWIQISTSIGIGWVSGKYVELNDGSSQQVQPTAIPPTQAPQATAMVEVTAETSGGINCGGAGYNDSSGVVFISYPLEEQVQCLEYVRRQYPDYFNCLKQAGWHWDNPGPLGTDQWNGAYNTAVWAKKAPSCSLSVESASDPNLDLNKLASREWLMVWDTECGGAGRDSGHIGIYLGQYDYTKQQIYIDESNWDKQDGLADGVHWRSLQSKWFYCITLIHVGLPPGDKQTASGNQPPNQNDSGSIPPGTGIGSGNATATDITIGVCIFCTSQYWVAFELPRDHYDPNSLRLTFMGNDISWKEKTVSKVGTNDKIIFLVSSGTIQHLIDIGEEDKLSDINNWHLYYTMTK